MKYILFHIYELKVTLIAHIDGECLYENDMLIIIIENRKYVDQFIT